MCRYPVYATWVNIVSSSPSIPPSWSQGGPRPAPQQLSRAEYTARVGAAEGRLCSINPCFFVRYLDIIYTVTVPMRVCECVDIVLGAWSGHVLASQVASSDRVCIQSRTSQTGAGAGADSLTGLCLALTDGQSLPSDRYYCGHQHQASSW